jgi:hypothetical protein
MAVAERKVHDQKVHLVSGWVLIKKQARLSIKTMLADYDPDGGLKSFYSHCMKSPEPV